jgi:hypothetical protein
MGRLDIEIRHGYDDAARAELTGVGAFTRIYDAQASGDAEALAGIAFALSTGIEDLELRIVQLRACIHSLRGRRVTAVPPGIIEERDGR